MGQGPVPDGESTTDKDAMTAGHAALDDEPSWLDEDLPPDREGGDERDWPGDIPDWHGDAEAVAAQAERDGAEYAAVTARLIAAGIKTAAAHLPGTPIAPGIRTGPAGGFAQSEPLDRAAPSPALDWAADYASGDDRAFGGVSDDELFGVLGARQRLESRQAWEKLMGLAELIRRRPAPGCKLAGPGRMPQVWAEGTAAEVSVQFAITQRAADGLLSLAWDLAVKLPLTSANLRVAGRPGTQRGAGPIDPDQVRDLADAASKNPKTTYQFTITDPDGRPIAHARGRPGPDDLARRKKPGNPATGPPRLTLIDRGPPGGYGFGHMNTADGRSFSSSRTSTAPATTAIKHPVTTPASTFATSPACCTPNAPSPPAAPPSTAPTTSTPHPTTRAASPVYAHADQSAAATTGTSRDPAGRSTERESPAGSGGNSPADEPTSAHRTHTQYYATGSSSRPGDPCLPACSGIQLAGCPERSNFTNVCGSTPIIHARLTGRRVRRG
ncbi:MAG TPA: hypothetical protein VF070_20870 [Streptosporangiaceae bacterium]